MSERKTKSTEGEETDERRFSVSCCECERVFCHLQIDTSNSTPSSI